LPVDDFQILNLADFWTFETPSITLTVGAKYRFSVLFLVYSFELLLFLVIAINEWSRREIKVCKFVLE